jgi:DNA mismatch repair protein MutS
MPGGTDRSYGIQVAKLAGVPDPVLRRAGDVLKALEATAKGTGQSPAQSLAQGAKRLQMTLFEAERHPVLEELEALDLGTLSPIEALTKLYDLQRQAKG